MTRRLAIAAVLLGALAAGHPATAEDLFVMTSTVNGLEEGAIVDGRATLAVPAGTRVTLVSDTGRVIEIEGPFTGSPAPESVAVAEAGLLDALGQLFEGKEKSGQAGVFRYVVILPRPDDPWMIDTTRWGRYCVPADKPPLLWRATTEQEVRLAIQKRGTGARGATRWGRGAATTPWPKELPPEDGANYLVRIQGNVTGGNVTLHLVPADLDGAAERIVWLVRRGCVSQARLLLDTLR